MKKIKLIAPILAGAFLLAACAAPQPTPAPAQEPTTLEDVAPQDEEDTATGGIIVMGTNAEFPPFEFIAEPSQGRFGQYSGIDIAIGMRIAEALGADLVIEDMLFEALIFSLANNQVDFVAAGLTITEERAQEVDFSIAYYTASQALLVSIDNEEINTAQDLIGTVVGVQLGTTSYFIASEIEGVEVLAYPRPVDAVIAVLNDHIDAVMMDVTVAHNFLNAYPEALRIVYDDDFFGTENYGIAVAQGNPELLAVINQVIEEMLSNGEIAELMIYYTED